MNEKTELNWESIAEISALAILGAVAIIAMFKLGVEGKDITLSVAAGIIGYLAKTGKDMAKTNLDK